jgi:hypothetical protein
MRKNAPFAYVDRHEPVVVVLGHLVDQARQPARRVDDHDVEAVQVSLVWSANRL